MRTGVCRNAIGATVLVLATGSAVAEDSGVLAVYTYPIEAVQKAAADALTDIGCEIEKNQGGYIEGVRRHKFGAFAGSGGERVSVNLTSASEGVTSVDIRTKKTFVGYVQQRNWDETVRDGIRQHMLAPAVRKDETQPQGTLVQLSQPLPPKRQETQPPNFIFAPSESPARQTANGDDIGSGLVALAAFAGEVFLAYKGYAVAPVIVPPASPQTHNPPVVSQSPTRCPDGSYVNRPPCTMCPNGRYVGGSSGCAMAPDGTFAPGSGAPQMAPDGTFHAGGGPLTMCPNGSYVTGAVCVLTPNGGYVGR